MNNIFVNFSLFFFNQLLGRVFLFVGLYSVYKSIQLCGHLLGSYPDGLFPNGRPYFEICASLSSSILSTWSSHSVVLLFDHFTTSWILHLSRINLLVSLSLKVTSVIVRRVFISVAVIFCLEFSILAFVFIAYVKMNRIIVLQIFIFICIIMYLLF